LDALDSLPGSIEDNLIQRSYAIKNLEYIIASINCEMSNMKERRDKLQNNLDNLQKSCINAMQIAGIEKIDKCPHFKVSRRKNRVAVEILDEKSIAPGYIKIKNTWSFDKELIKEDIEKGIVVEGAHLVQKERLVIK